MTSQEAQSLSRGDRVRVFWRGKVLTAVVQDSVEPQHLLLIARREGFTKSGARHKVLVVEFKDVELLSKRDDGTANVYADWLEEHGQHRAAALLREFFPMASAKRVPKL